jgi:hypothetical protein
MPADGSGDGDRKSVGDDQNTDGVDYDGPIIAAAGPGGPGAGGPWIWIANGTNPRMFEAAQPWSGETEPVVLQQSRRRDPMASSRAPTQRRVMLPS